MPVLQDKSKNDAALKASAHNSDNWQMRRAHTFKQEDILGNNESVV